MVEDKDKKSRFLEETFLLADISMDVAFGIFFLIFSNIEINFTEQELKERLYTTVEVFPTTWQKELIGKKEFAAITLDLKDEIFVVHDVAFASFGLDVYSFYQA